MKIEKVNDHQIRCTLTKKELEKRDLKLSEIAYGNEKVKRLFQDMMQMAAYEFDFEAEDTPLMIEVIPFTECAVIIITKVEDPDELDTRFSRFAPSVQMGENTLSGLIGDVFQSITEKHEDIAELFRKVQEHNDAEVTPPEITEEAPQNREHNIFFCFPSLNEVIRACRTLAPLYSGASSVYKNNGKNQFILYLKDTTCTDEDFARICNILSEYAPTAYDNGYYKFFVNEHCEVILAEHAVQTLAGI